MAAALDRVRGQETAITTIKRALASGRVHHALLFDGPGGVGKELAAFGLAQALVCERPHDGLACGECSACLRSIPREGETRPLHPDVVVLERGLYEPAQIGRRTPEAQDISIDQVRTLVLARAAFRAHEGRAKVFIIRRAEELSTSAANALLKTLEEPGQGTHFILLTTQPDALLPTIRSRTLRIRFGGLSDALTNELLVARGVDAEAAARITALAGGSMATAMTYADPDQSTDRERFLARAKAALDAVSAAPAMEIAEIAKSNKTLLVPALHALLAELTRDGREHADADNRRADVAAARFQLVLSALEQLDGNASPQLATESLFIRMRAIG